MQRGLNQIVIRHYWTEELLCTSVMRDTVLWDLMKGTVKLTNLREVGKEVFQNVQMVNFKLEHNKHCMAQSYFCVRLLYYFAYRL